MFPANTQNTLPEKMSALDRALARIDARNRAKTPVRVGFLVDATGSRDESWEQAQTIQAGMFKKVAGLRSLSLRLVHFGGNEMADHGWQTDTRALAAQMAQVRCVTGLTQILPGLEKFLEFSEGERTHAIILVGDYFEENIEEAKQVALALKGAGIKVFAFLEGDDWTAEAVFGRLANVTGGAFTKFGADLPLADLCKGVALLSAGGEKALKRLENKRARHLLLGGPSGK